MVDDLLNGVSIVDLSVILCFYVAMVSGKVCWGFAGLSIIRRIFLCVRRYL